MTELAIHDRIDLAYALRDAAEQLFERTYRSEWLLPEEQGFTIRHGDSIFRVVITERPVRPDES